MTSDDDLELTEQAVAAAFEGWDRVPTAEMQRAREIFELRSIDTELAELVAQSGVLEGARGEPGEEEHLTFRTPAISIEIEVLADLAAGTSRVAGQLVPPSPALVTLQGTDQSTSARADDLGRFLLEALPGAARLLVELDSGGTTVATEFFRV